MRAFKFRLQRLLRLSHRKEEALRKDWAIAMQAREELRLRTERMQRARSDAEELGNSLSPASCMALAYEENLVRKLRALEGERIMIQERVDKAHADWQEARMALKQIEKLEEIERQRHEQQVAKQEQKELEELAELGRRAKARRRF